MTTVALDRVCVRVWRRHVWPCMCACICQENVYVKENMCMHTAVRCWQLSKNKTMPWLNYGGGGGTLQGGESKVSRKVAVQLRLQNGEPKASSLLHGGNGWSPEGSTARAASWQSSLSCCTAWSTCQQGALPTAWRSAPLHVAELRPWWRRREWNPRGAPSKIPGACSSLPLPGWAKI